MEWNQTAFAERLGTALSNKSWSQKFLAEEFFEGKDHIISNWMNERSRPLITDILLSAKALGVRAAWLAFDDGFEPMDDEEREIVELIRKMDDTDRATLRAFLASMTAGKPAAARFGKRSKPSSPSDALASEQSKYRPLHLPPEQLHAFLNWMLGEVEKMPAERPLTIACYEIAKRLSHDNVLPMSAETSVEPAIAQDTPETSAASEEASSPPTSHRKKAPPSPQSPSVLPPKKGKNKPR